MSVVLTTVPLKVGHRRIISGALSIVLMLVLSASGTTHAAWPAQAPPPPVTPAPVKPILLTDPIPDPHQDGVLWFPTTGHTLRGPFLSYWKQNGGLAQFGYPLTEEFFEPASPDNKLVQVQYFERNRFEHHPENQPPYDVLLGTLGREFHPQDPPASELPSPAIYFPETGHSLSGAFQQYWQAHGGLAVHGYPITEAFQEKNPIDGKTYTVQYLERSRFELHPENAGSPYEVLLGLLGRQLSEKRGYPYGWYPLFGHAVDWTWVSGRYFPDPRMCFLCGCATIRFVYGSTFLDDKSASIQPLGRPWSVAIDSGLITGRALPIIVFGYMAGPDEPKGFCVAPGYIVEQLSTNPME